MKENGYRRLNLYPFCCFHGDHITFLAFADNHAASTILNDLYLTSFPDLSAPEKTENFRDSEHPLDCADAAGGCL